MPDDRHHVDADLCRAGRKLAAMARTEPGRQVRGRRFAEGVARGGTKLAWKTTGLGRGYASMLVAAGRLFTMGDEDGAGYVIALDDADGNILWSARVGSAGAPEMKGYSCHLLQ